MMKLPIFTIFLGFRVHQLHVDVQQPGLCEQGREPDR
jgi:hypothetical protein